MPSLIRVLVVDHNPIFREGICALIRMQSDLELATAVATADEAVRLFVEKRPDLTLIDLDLLSHGGIDAIRRIRRLDPASWLIGLVTDECNECCPPAVDAGAAAVLAKDSVGKMLVPLIDAGPPART